jgi:hypothetical protein
MWADADDGPGRGVGPASASKTSTGLSSDRLGGVVDRVVHRGDDWSVRRVTARLAGSAATGAGVDGAGSSVSSLLFGGDWFQQHGGVGDELNDEDGGRDRDDEDAVPGQRAGLEERQVPGCR